MRLQRVTQLLALQVALLGARWRSAWTRPLGKTAALTGGGVSLAGGALLVLAAIAFGGVGATLLGALARAEHIELAGDLAAALADVAALLVIATVALSDAQRTGVDPRPLSLLPLGRSERLALDALSVLLLQPSALVLWSASLGLLVGGAMAGRAPLVLPAASGLALLIAALAVLIRRVLGSRGFGRSSPLVRGLVLLLPALWLVGVLRSGSEGLARTPPPFPGFWCGAAFERALVGDVRAVPLGLALHLIALGVLLSATHLSRLPFTPGRPRRGRRLRLPAEWRRTWAPRRAATLLSQSLGAVVITLFFGAVLARHGLPRELLGTATTIVALWLLAAAPTPLLANVLGLGGRAAASAGLVPASGALLLVRGLAAALAPVALALPLLALSAAWVFGAPGLFPLALSGGAGVALAGAGAGAVHAVLWPRAAALRDDGDPIWSGGAGRLLLPIAQGLAASPLILGFAGGGTVAPWRAFATLLAGGALAAAGIALASRLYAKRRLAVLEALLS